MTHRAVESARWRTVLDQEIGVMKRLAMLAIGCVLVIGTSGVLAEEAVKADGKSEAAVKASQVKLETTLGNIVVELDAVKAPLSTENFLRYVREGFYDGLIFHRVIPNFMIQGGGMDAEMEKKRDGMHSPIKLESDNGLLNVRGTIAMARTNAPHSATSQFFINVVDNPPLDYNSSQPNPNGYAVFGKVVEGMETVDKIRDTECITHPKYPAGSVVPATAVVINKAYVVGEEKKAAESEKAEPEKAAPEAGKAAEVEKTESPADAEKSKAQVEEVPEE